MPRPGPRTIARYSEHFKATVVRLSDLPGVAVQYVAAIFIHPFMLSRWRKQVREGLIVTKGVKLDEAVSAQLKELRKLKKEHDLPKKPSLHFGATSEVFAFIEHCEGAYPIRMTCRLYGVSAAADGDPNVAAHWRVEPRREPATNQESAASRKRERSCAIQRGRGRIEG